MLLPYYKETIENDLKEHTLTLKRDNIQLPRKITYVEMFSHILLNQDLLQYEYSFEMTVEVMLISMRDQGLDLCL